MRMQLQCTWCHSCIYFFFSDDLLEDSDSEEHSRSESVTGRLYNNLEVIREVVLFRLLKNPYQNQ